MQKSKRWPKPNEIREWKAWRMRYKRWDFLRKKEKMEKGEEESKAKIDKQEQKDPERKYERIGE